MSRAELPEFMWGDTSINPRYLSSELERFMYCAEK